jgi:hypothetical protein
LSFLANKIFDNVEDDFLAFRAEVISLAPTAEELLTYCDREPKFEATIPGVLILST